MLFALAAAAALSANSPGPSAADLVLTDGRIYTVDAGHTTASAIAVKDGRIVFVGAAADAHNWIGSATHVESLHGRLVLPGLIDAHMHPIDIVDLDVCNLDSRPVTLRQLSEFVGQCLEKYHTPPGQLLVVHQWSYTAGNQPDPQHPTLRAALDKVSTKVPIQLLGNDAHHGAFNSLGLALARNAQGKAIGLSKATLAGEFAGYKALVGVDSTGEPNGAVNEDARYLINPHSMLYTDLAAVSKVPEKIPQRLNSVGITAMLDAMAAPDGLPVYDSLLASGKLTVRATLAQFYDPSHTRKPDGSVDYDAMVAKAKSIREKYANNPLLHADFIKLFADGVLEGNPFAVPPTLPNAAALKPFLQPIFAVDDQGHATVKGYVDTASATCVDVRAHPANYTGAAQIDEFLKAHGHHPAQCALSQGQLQHSREIILEYVKRMHLAGFNMHIHAISDRSVRTAVDAIEAARQADGVSSTRDSLAHLQLVAPEDVARIGKDHLYVAFTYAWMNTDPDYDITVIPFFQKVSGNSYEALHPPGSYFEQNTYPVKAVKNAGGILAGGSDAPVETRDPRPFINMSRAVTRAYPGKPALSPQQSITIRDAIDAYTINGARMLNIQKEAGSLETGKSADFIILDRDILALADSGKPEAVADTKVLETWFQGKKVYAAADASAAAPASTADTLYLNGSIYTVDAKDSVKEAVAVKDGRILYVGTNAGAKALASPITHVVDLQGRMMMPGLVDGHMHPLQGGTVLLKCNLDYERLTIKQFQERIQACLDKTSAREPDQWLEVVNWFQQDMLPPGVEVSRETLDQLKTRRPIAVMSSFGHTVAANSRALQLGHVDKTTPDPVGGKIHHDANGEPTGLLEDAAFDLVMKLIPEPTARENVAAAHAAQDAIRKQGITSFLDADAETVDLEAFSAVQKEGGLTVRGHFAPPIRPATHLDADKAVAAVKAIATRFDQGPRKPEPTISVHNTKLFLDGVITAPAFTGAMLEPYLTRGQDRGPPVYFPAPTLRALLLGLARNGLEPHMHADGDRAVHEGLDAIEALRKEFPESRIRAAIAHDEIVSPADFPRYAALGAIPVLSMQWEKPASDTIEGAREFLGPERFKYMEPAGYLAAAGARIAFGSDWPVDRLDEWFALKVGVTRENSPSAGPNYAGRLSTDPGLSVPAVLRAITANAAYELHAENEVGTIEAGKFADLIVLDRNVTKIPARQIADTRVLLTIVGGKPVFAAPPFEGVH